MKDTIHINLGVDQRVPSNASLISHVIGATSPASGVPPGHLLRGSHQRLAPGAGKLSSLGVLTAMMSQY